MKVKKPKFFYKTGKWSEKTLMSKSISTLYRIKREEKNSLGTWKWYTYPDNIQKLLDYCIKKKKQ